MTDYSKMSDFEINCVVAFHIGLRTVELAEEGKFNPCNNPADAWPIIEQNYISLTFDGISWDASSALSEITYNAWKTHPYQPLRLAMIVFLMMKEAEQCSS